MVVDHVHHDTDSVVMESLNHLLELTDPHFSVEGIGGIAAFRRVVILRVISPVELRGIAALVHCGIIVDGLEMNMGDAQLLQVIHPGRKAGGVCQAGFREGQVFSGISGGSQPVGEIPDMHFPDHGILIALQPRVKAAAAEAFR